MAGKRIDPKAKERFAVLVGLGYTQHESARAVGLHTPGKPVLVPLVTVPDSATGLSRRGVSRWLAGGPATRALASALLAFSCKVSAVVYTRVPEALKQTLQARAQERGLSLNAVTLELFERALEPLTSDGLEEQLAVCARELERIHGRLAQAELGLQAAREREQQTARTYRALAERARHELALCPQCRKPVRGSDLLVSGHCPNCNRPITALLTPRPQTGAPDKDAYLALLGALGALLGLALATSSDDDAD